MGVGRIHTPLWRINPPVGRKNRRGALIHTPPTRPPLLFSFSGPVKVGARPCERSTMFVVERREVGKLLWEIDCQCESMLLAEMAKADFENDYIILDYEWRVREVKVPEDVGEKV